VKPLEAPSWDLDGHDWPQRSASRFVLSHGTRWRLTDLGEGPVALLVHGTGASSHSFHALSALLARDFRVLAPDLPSHAFTQSPAGFVPSLPRVASAIAQLLEVVGLRPALVVGHSAGAAISAQLVLDGALSPELFVSINGAFFPFRGLPGVLFPNAARLLARSEHAVRAFSRRAHELSNVQRVLESTGSVLPLAEIVRYQRLAQRPGHLAGVLSMLAHWDLEPLERALPRLDVPALLVAGVHDRAVPPAQAALVQRRIPGAQLKLIPGGHLVHEERPEAVERLIRQAWDQRQR
jgi:magnesium chelatase accessory protein